MTAIRFRASVSRAALAVAAATILLAGCDRPRLTDAFKSAEPAAAVQAATNEAQAPVVLAAVPLAVLTPTATFGQEENRQSLAMLFSEAMGEARPDLSVMPLSETLSRINAAGLSEPYDKMYTVYRNTGLLDRDTLRRVGEATGARYLVQLKLQSMNQNNRQRFSYFGISLLQTQSANARLFLQIWDAEAGRIVWERTAEASRQTESIRERPVTMQTIVRAAAADLVREFPQRERPPGQTAAR
ncbi:MAG: hypothetical protein AB7P02_06210 [Alphaproteobacteria bacterium]